MFVSMAATITLPTVSTISSRKSPAECASCYAGSGPTPGLQETPGFTVFGTSRKDRGDGPAGVAIDRVFPFVQANQALAYVEAGRAKGKVVIKLK